MKSPDSSSPKAGTSAVAQKSIEADRSSGAWAKADGVVIEPATEAAKGRGRKKGSPEDLQDELNNQQLAAVDPALPNNGVAPTENASSATANTYAASEPEGDRRTTGYSTNSTNVVPASNNAAEDRAAAKWAKQDMSSAAGWGDAGLYGLLGGGLALGMSAGGGGKSGNSGSTPTDGGTTTTPVSIRASDTAGIRDAKVYAINAENKEVLIGTTDKDGHLAVNSDKWSQTLVLKGGVNISTGLPNTLEMHVKSEAVDKQFVINPITTLVAAVYDAALALVVGAISLEQAEQAVKDYLGIPAQINLQTFDPLDASVEGTDSALSYLQLEAALSTIIGSAAVGQDFLQALAEKIANDPTTDASIDLSSVDDLSDIMGSPSDSQLLQLQDVADNNALILEQVSISKVQEKYREGWAPVIVDLVNYTVDSEDNKVTTNASLKVSGLNTGSSIQYQYSVDGGTLSDWVSAVNPSAEGKVTVQARLAYSGGVVSEASDAFTFNYIKPSVPTAPKLSLKEDSGDLVTDLVSNKGELVLSGVLPDTVIEYSIDGQNTWQEEFTPTTDGVYDVYVRQTYIGKGSDEASPPSLFKFILDTVSHAGTAGLSPTTVEGQTENDTGYIDANDSPIDGTFSDGITNNNKPVLSGKTEAGATSVTVVLVKAPAAGTVALRAASLVSAAEVENTDTTTFTITPPNLDAEGNWTLELTEPLEDGVYTPVITVVDRAGNESEAKELSPFTVDTIAPEILAEGVSAAAFDLPSNTDSGLKGDNITNVQKPVFTGTAEPNAYVFVSIEGETFTVKTDDQGKWTVEVNAPLEEGDHDVNVTVIDGAGNATDLDPYTFTVDLTPPEVTTSARLLAEEEADTGLSSEDGITSNTLPTIVGTVEEGTFVSAILNEKRYALVAEDGDWSFTVPEGEELPDGTYTVKIVYTDDAGNELGEESVPFTIDTEAPSLDEYDLVREADNDTGIEAEDGITKNNSPVFRGTVALRDDDTVEPGLIVRVTIGDNDPFEAEVNEDGTWEVVALGLEDGEYEPLIQLVDLAGNVSDGDALTLTVDTEAPDATAELVHDEDNDTGADTEDNITSNPSPVLSGETDPLAHVVLEINGDIYETDADDDGLWSIQVEGLEAGEYTPIITVTDVAGNESDPIDGTSFTVAVPVDLTVGTAEFIHDEENDTGIDADDGITNNSSPTFVGTGSPGAIARLDFGDDQVFEAEVDEDGNWELTANGLADGEYSPTLIMLDAEGNEGEALDIDIQFTIDTTAPEEGDVIGALATDSDTGVADDDGLTSEKAPVLKGTAEAGTKVVVEVDGTEYTVDEVDESGEWEVQLNELDDGEYTPTITVIDKAGNETQVDGTLFTIDATAPNYADPAGELVHDEDNDTGIDSEDNLTNNPTPTLFGDIEDADNATLTLVLLNTTTGEEIEIEGIEVDENGHWEHTVDSDLADGKYTLAIVVTDVAGNVSQEIEGTAFEVDTTIDLADGVVSGALSSVSDTGLPGDNVTNEDSPTLVGRGVPGTTVRIELNGEFFEDVVAADGSWSVDTFGLADDEYTPIITFLDVAGNESEATEGTPFTIDTTPPDEADVTSGLLAGADNDTGSSDEDTITANASPTYSGTAPAGSLVVVDVSPTHPFLYLVRADEDGNWQVQFDPLGGGEYFPSILVVDEAGNETVIDGTPFTIDIEAPSQGDPVVELVHDEDNDTGADTQDNLTNNPTPTLFGDMEDAANATLTLVLRNTTTGEEIEIEGIEVDENGHWEHTVDSDLADGKYTLAIVVTDVAGNVSQEIEGTAFEVDTTIDVEEGLVTGALSSVSDTGLPGDNVTNEDSPTLVGRGVPGLTVRVDVGGEIFESIVKVDGTWAVQTSGLSEGEHTPSITLLDKAGNESESFDGESFTVDLTAPEVNTPAHLLDEEEVDTGVNSDDGITNNNLPTIVGSVEEGAFVTAILNGKRYALVADDGDWSFTVPEGAELEDGTYTVNVIYTDDAGNVLREESVPFTIDTEAPSLDESDLVHEADNDTGIDPEDGITNNNSPVFRGVVTLRDDDTVEPGLIVRVTIGDNVFETDVIGDDGSWEVVADGLDDGDYEPIIQVIDIAGNVSDELTVTLTVDTEAPESTAELVHDEENDTGADTEDNLTSNTSPMLSGETEPFAHVVLDINGAIYEADADEEGLWSIQVEGLEAGEYTPVITVTDLAGNEFAGDGTTFVVMTGPDLSVGTAEFVHSEETDTGFDAEDGITSNNSPSFVGTGSPGAIVRMDFNGEVFESLVDEDGNWTLTADGLDDGEYAPTITMADEDGNEGDPLDIEISFTIDTEVPTEATAELMHDEFSDSGADQEDNITNITSPTLTGETEAFAKVEVEVDGETYEATADENGAWEVALVNVSEGLHTPLITITDVAGNISEPIEGTPFTVVTTIELDAPVFGGLVHDEENDTGIDPDDNITNNASPTLAGEGIPGLTVRVDLDGVFFEAEVNEDGTWELTVDGLTDGQYTPVITFLDVAGNESEPTDGESFEVDTAAPFDGEGALTVDSDNDTGAANDDGVTSNTAPLMKGIAEVGSTVIVTLDDGSEYFFEGVDESGTWEIGLSDLADGEYNPVITIRDAAGNESTMDGTPFTIDTEAPSEATGELVHDEDNDTGADQEDNITNNTSPVLQGETDPLAFVTVTIGGITYEPVQADEDGLWELQVENLSAGDYTPSITVTDLAGNESEAFEGTPFTVLTSTSLGLPGGGITHDEENDTGADIADGLTNNSSPTFSGFGGTVGNIVRVTLDDGSTFDGEVDADGNWVVETSGLSDGEYTPTITFLDIAGNESEAFVSDTFTVDTQAPDDGEVSLTTGSDTGVADDDGITSKAAPVLKGTAEAGSKVIVEVDGTEYIIDEVGESGEWELELTTLINGENIPTTLTDGEYTPTINVIDKAGNETGAVDGTPFVIDTQAPTEATGELVHDEDNDTGADQEDNITNNTSPTLMGDITDAENGTVTLLIRNNATGIDIEVKDIAVDEAGHWEYTLEDTLVDGEHTVSIIATDVAGNSSEPIAGTPFTVMTSAALSAPVNGGLTHDADNDTGVLTDDNLTNFDSPTISGTGAPAGTTVRVSFADQDLVFEAEVNADGTWVVETSGLLEGEYTPSITFLDIAGNESEAFEGDMFTVDTQAPDEGEAALSPDSDLGESGEDGITSEKAPTLKGTAEAGAKVIVEVDGTEYIIDEVDDTGEWEITLNELVDGEYTPTINVIDKAGNETGAVDGTPFVIDTEAPADATAELLHDALNDTGSESDDNITNNTSPTLSGEVEALAKVKLSIDGQDYETTADENGAWSIQVANLSDGEHTPVLIITDAAGNESIEIEGTPFTVDHTAPDLGTGELVHDEDNDTGVSTDDNFTSNASPTLVGEAEDGAIVSITINGQVQETVADGGEWEVSFSDLPDGTWTPSISVTDVAGNVTVSQGTPFVVDTSVPDTSGITGGLVHDATNDTGASTTDSITRNPAPLLRGTAPALADVLVVVDGNEYPTTANISGVWEVQLEALGDETYTPEITVVDLAGNQSAPVNGTPFTIVTEASGDASGELVHDAINDTGADAEDGITSNSRPTLSGTADPGASVLIQLDATHSYTTQATLAGVWSFKLPASLPDGEYTPFVSVTDLAGNSSEPVEGAPIIIDTKVDNATGGLTHDATNDAGVSSTDSITNNNLPQLSGRAEANAAVRVTLGSLVFETVADEEGAWAVDVDQELANGIYTPTLEVTDIAGNKKTFTGEAFTVNLSVASDGINIGTHFVALSGENADPTVLDFSGGTGQGTFEDYSGTLPAGLVLDAETGLVTGKPTALGFTWISSVTTDTAGNEFTSFSQLVVTTGEKSIQGSATFLTINNVNPDKPMTYIGTSGKNSMNVYRSVGDVILSGEGNDTFNMVDPGTKDEFLPMDFARLDGGAGIDTIKIYGKGMSIDFADFNNPDGAGKAMQHIEVVNLASREMEVTISVGDVFRMQSDLFDSNSVNKMVRFVTTKTSGSSATLDGFTQVGAGSDFQEDGAFTSNSGKAVYNKYTGTYSDATGDHLVTLLLHEGLVVS